MSVNCPDNSTECLLRVLIETTANQTSPWEPRSFGFTVAIGVAAFLISFIAIFQGLLAAGPGRIKASSNAIGAFSTLTKGKLSWIEFAWRSTAYVPFINYDGLREALQNQSVWVPHGTNYPFRNSGMITTGATWLQLFRSIGLDEQVEVIFTPSLRACATDHLPADIQNPPIFIELQSLVILAAIADPSIEFKSVDNSINIQGRMSQISFRDHPVLGRIGGYERYQNKPPYGYEQSVDEVQNLPFFTVKGSMTAIANAVKAMLQGCAVIMGRSPIPKPEPTIAPFAVLGRCTPLALDLANGCLRIDYMWDEKAKAPYTITLTKRPGAELDSRIYKWHMPHNVPPHYEDSSTFPYARALALMVAQTDYEIRPFPWEGHGFDKVIKFLTLGWNWVFTDHDVFAKYMEPSGFRHQAADAIGYEQRDAFQDSYFEYLGSWIVPDDKGLSFSGDFDDSLISSIYYHCEELRRRVEADESGRKHDAEDLWRGSGRNTARELKHVDILLRRKGLRAVDALDALTAKLKANDPIRPYWQFQPPEPSRPSSRESVNNWVAYNQIAIPLSESAADMRALQRAMNETILGKPPDRPSGEQPEEDTVPELVLRLEEPKVSEDVYLEVLLVTRALLFAALLRTATDTSGLFQYNFKNPVVKII